MKMLTIHFILLLLTAPLQVEPLWTAAIGDTGHDTGYSSVAVGKDRLLITGNANEKSTVFCLSLDGQELWTYDNGPVWTEQFPGTRGTPLIDPESQYGYDQSPLGELVCLDLESGQPLWRCSLAEEYDTPPPLYGWSGSLLMEGEVLYVLLGREKASILCLNRITGTEILACESTGNASGYGTPILFEFAGLPLMAAMDAKGVFAVNRKTGKLMFHQDHRARLDENITSPIFHVDRLFVTNAVSDSKQLKLILTGPDKIETEIVWTNRLLANSHGGVTLHNGRLYGSTSKSGTGFACISWEDGANVFHDTENVVRGSFAVDTDNATFYILTEFGEVIICHPEETGFSVQKRWQLPGGEIGNTYAHPTLHGNRLYIRISGILYCFEVAQSASCK